MNSNKAKVFGLIPVLILAVFVAACSSAPLDDYNRLITSHSSVMNSVQEAVIQSKAKQLSLGEAEKAEITIDGHVIRIGDALASYKVFSTPTLNSGNYQIRVVSGCFECFGFRKKTLLPYVVVIDSENQIVETGNRTEKAVYGYAVEGTIRVDRAQQFSILVAADNRKVGQSSSQFDFAIVQGTFIPMTIPVEVSPEGWFAILVRPSS